MPTNETPHNSPQRQVRRVRFQKFDSGKPRMELLPPYAIRAAVCGEAWTSAAPSLFGLVTSYMAGEDNLVQICRWMLDSLDKMLGNPRQDDLPARALREVAKVLTFGAAKYGESNWRLVEDRSRYTGALLRHLTYHVEAWEAASGPWDSRLAETLDDESGLPHYAHATTCALFLLECELCGLGTDPVRLAPAPAAGTVSAEEYPSATFPDQRPGAKDPSAE